MQTILHPKGNHPLPWFAQRSCVGCGLLTLFLLFAVVVVSIVPSCSLVGTVACPSAYLQRMESFGKQDIIAYLRARLAHPAYRTALVEHFLLSSDAYSLQGDRVVFHVPLPSLGMAAHAADGTSSPSQTPWTIPLGSTDSLAVETAADLALRDFFASPLFDRLYRSWLLEHLATQLPDTAHRALTTPVSDENIAVLKQKITGEGDRGTILNQRIPVPSFSPYERMTLRSLIVASMGEEQQSISYHIRPSLDPLLQATSVQGMAPSPNAIAVIDLERLRDLLPQYADAPVTSIPTTGEAVDALVQSLGTPHSRDFSLETEYLAGVLAQTHLFLPEVSAAIPYQPDFSLADFQQSAGVVPLAMIRSLQQHGENPTTLLAEQILPFLLQVVATARSISPQELWEQVRDNETFVGIMCEVLGIVLGPQQLIIKEILSLLLEEATLHYVLTPLADIYLTENLFSLEMLSIDTLSEKLNLWGIGTGIGGSNPLQLGQSEQVATISQQQTADPDVTPRQVSSTPDVSSQLPQSQPAASQDARIMGMGVFGDLKNLVTSNTDSLQETFQKTDIATFINGGLDTTALLQVLTHTAEEIRLPFLIFLFTCGLSILGLNPFVLGVLLAVLSRTSLAPLITDQSPDSQAASHMLSTTVVQSPQDVLAAGFAETWHGLRDRMLLGAPTGDMATQAQRIAHKESILPSFASLSSTVRTKLSGATVPEYSVNLSQLEAQDPGDAEVAGLEPYINDILTIDKKVSRCTESPLSPIMTIFCTHATADSPL